MINVRINGKTIDTTEIRKMFVQGEASALHICFLVPAEYAGLTWTVRGTSEQAGTVAEQAVTAADGTENIAVDWEPESAFCANGGQLHITLVGSDAIGTVVIKAVGDVEVQRDPSMDGHTPVSEDLYEQLIAEARECVDDAEAAQEAAETAQAAAGQSATNAGESATEAAESATNAEASADRAEAAAVGVETYAQAAAESAQDAAGSATAAAGSATEASGSATAAAGSATAASGSKDEAEESKTAAEAAQEAAETAQAAAGQSATNAGESATAAAESATEASGSATAAAGSATAAAGSATAAAGSATEAAESAEQAAGTLANAEMKENKVTQIDGESSDTQYPSAKCVRDSIIRAVGGNDALFVAMLDGTPANYRAVMKAWMNANGAAALADYAPLLDRWYMITRTGWNGGVSFPAPSVSDVSTGTRVGDNVGMSCTPSTNTVAGRDDYAGLPLFAVVDCNWTLSEDGKPHIQAVDGVCGSFDRYSQEKLVGVLQMTGFVKYAQTAGEITYSYSDEWEKPGYYPLPEAVDLDGNVRPWVVHGKYGMGEDWGCYSGVAPMAWSISHNTMLSGVRTAWGNQYCGKTSADDAFMKIMWWIKYASWTMDGIMNGCCSYYYNTYSPAVAETGVERIVLTNAQAGNLLVGSTICLGSTSYGSKSAQCSVIDRKRIMSKEAVTIGGTEYTALNIDNGGVTFDTTTALLLSTMHWYAGSCDDVKGNDGSPTNNTSGKEVCKLQGIEFRFGAYEIICDSILQYFEENAVNKLRVNVCREAAKLATSITADYTACAYSVDRPAESAWTWIKEMGYDSGLPEVIAPTQTGGSSSTYMRDAFYILAASSGSYEWLSLGHLYNGVTITGLSCGNGYSGLASAYWHIASRLSATGNRGEYAA